MYLAVDRDGDTLNCEAVVANISGSRCVLALAGAAALDPGTGATVTAEALAAGEVPGVFETGRGPVCFLSSPCREVLFAPKNNLGSNTVAFAPRIDIMTITRLRHRHSLSAGFLDHQNNVANENFKSEGKSKKSKRAKHARTILAVDDSSGSQSAVESEDSNGGRELGGELGEALQEVAGRFQKGKDGQQAQKSSEKKKKSKGKQKKRGREGSEDLSAAAILASIRNQRELNSKTMGEGKSAKKELSGEEDRRAKKGRGRGRGRGEKADEE